MDDHETKVEDEDEVAELRARARRINTRALITATVVTLVALAFPR